MDGWITIGTRIDDKNFDKQIDSLDKKAMELEKKISKDKKLKIDTTETEAKLEKIKNQILDLQKKDWNISLGSVKNIEFNTKAFTENTFSPYALDGFVGKLKEIKGETTYIAKDFRDLKKGIEDSGNSMTNLGKNTKKAESSISSLPKKIAKVSLALLGINSILTGLRRITNSYLSTNQDVSKKIEANWVGLSALLGPIIEGITNFFRKCVIAILHFASVLTGTNYIQKANLLLMKKQTQEVKNLAKATKELLTAGWDEMTILGDNNSSSYDGLSNIDTTPLFDIAELGEGTVKVIEKIANALKPVYEFIKDIIDFAVKHPDAILAIIGGVGLLTMLSKVIGLAGVGGAMGTGLAGILGALLAIASIGVIVISIKTIYDEAKKAKEENDKLVEATLEQKKATDELIVKLKEKFSILGKLDGKTKDYNTSLNGAINMELAHIKTLKEENDNVKWYEYGVRDLIGRTKAYRLELMTSMDTAYKYLENQKDLYEQNKLSSAETERYKQNMQDFIKTLDESAGKYDIATTSALNLGLQMGISKKQAEELKEKYINVKDSLDIMGITVRDTGNKVNNLGKDINSLPNGKDIKINANTSQAKSKIDEIAKALAGIIGGQFTFAYSAVANAGKKGYASGGISYNPPKMASGGILNLPGRGVMVGQAISGEAGYEGHVPLTNDRSLEIIGETIAKHVTINFTNVTRLNNRQIAREQKRINAQSDFAYNR